MNALSSPRRSSGLVHRLELNARRLARQLDQLLFRGAEPSQDIAQHHEGADQRRRAIFDFRPLDCGADVAAGDGESRRQIIDSRWIAPEVDVIGRFHPATLTGSVIARHH
jgi:hypothetical protein